jgi:mono/diheme cytochrome c family protein
MRSQLVLTFLFLALAACDQNMNDQSKYDQYEPAPLLKEGRTLEEPVPGTVARDSLDYERAKTEKPLLSAALLAQGRRQFDVFCSPCHSRLGDGNGIIVQRGMPRPPSFHIDRLRTADDQHFFDVISNGYGDMYSYAARVPAQDRWAIIAYIRALQLSQHASLDDVPPSERARLTAEKSQ